MRLRQAGSSRGSEWAACSRCSPRRLLSQELLQTWMRMRTATSPCHILLLAIPWDSPTPRFRLPHWMHPTHPFCPRHSPTPGCRLPHWMHPTPPPAAAALAWRSGSLLCSRPRLCSPAAPLFVLQTALQSGGPGTTGSGARPGCCRSGLARRPERTECVLAGQSSLLPWQEKAVSLCRAGRHACTWCPPTRMHSPLFARRLSPPTAGCPPTCTPCQRACHPPAVSTPGSVDTATSSGSRTSTTTTLRAGSSNMACSSGAVTLGTCAGGRGCGGGLRRRRGGTRRWHRPGVLCKCKSSCSLADRFGMLQCPVGA